MESETIYICEGDYHFFRDLSDGDKILCLFDIWVMDDQDDENLNKENLMKIIDSSIKNVDNANVIVTNDIVIINADSYKLVRNAVRVLFEQGFLLERKILTDSGNDVFRRQKYCVVYSIIGIVNPIIRN